MSLNDKWDGDIIPARVKYIGTDSDKFTTGKEYEAFFLEYWGIREIVFTSVVMIVELAIFIELMILKL